VGESVRFHCEVSPPGAKILWGGFGTDNGPLKGNNIITEGNDVVIDNVEKDDEGEYICAASNEFGVGRADPVRLVVLEEETHERDQVSIAAAQIEEPNDAEANGRVPMVEISPPWVKMINKGDSIIFKSVLIDVPKKYLVQVNGSLEEEGVHSVEYTWLRGTSIDSLLPLPSANKEILHIHNSQLTDSGLYIVKVGLNDGASLVSRPAYLVVLPNSPQDSIVVHSREDSDTVIACPIFVVPGASVQWSRLDGELIPNNTVVDGETLEIKSIAASAAGTYVCSVRFGQNTAETAVDIVVFPK